jgi:hypothetical protein
MSKYVDKFPSHIPSYVEEKWKLLYTLESQC